MAQCSASGSRSTSATDAAPASAAFRPTTPSPHPKSTTRFPATAAGSARTCAASAAALSQTSAQLGSGSRASRPVATNHSHSASDDGGRTMPFGRPSSSPSTCTIGGSARQPSCRWSAPLAALVITRARRVAGRCARATVVAAARRTRRIVRLDGRLESCAPRAPRPRASIAGTSTAQDDRLMCAPDTLTACGERLESCALSGTSATCGDRGCGVCSWESLQAL
mmetsp:Transcript_10271/g.30913  ORF Transcript_10271/g.30913 Transcript_10271/m.30913 type:complete len:224 (+) Transcript_10271:128-799(+)